MPKTTIKNIMLEVAWLAPELRHNEKFLEEWSMKKFGAKMDEELIPIAERYEEILEAVDNSSLASDGWEMIQAAMRDEA